MRLVTDGGGVCEGNVTMRSEGAAGWGLAAARPVAAGETLITLPRSLALTYGPGSDPALLAMIAKVPEELWSVRLALALLAERAKGDASRWAPYIATLPASYPGCPIFWGAEDLKALQYPPLAAQVAKRCKFLLDFTKGELDVLGGEGAGADPFGGVSVDVNGLGWALAATSSRAFRAGGPSQPGACLPLIDMCNHSFDPNCAISGDAKSGAAGALSVVTKRAVAEGEPLSLCYGELPNDFLLLDYHFVADANPHDAVELAFDPRMFSAAAQVAQVPEPNLKADGSPHPWQLKALEKLGLTDDRRLLVRAAPGKEVDARLVAAARVLAAEREADLQGAHGQLALEGRGETNATLLVVSQLVLTLQSFATPLEEDLEELKAAAAGTREMSAAQMNAARFRLGKKRVLLAAISVLTDELGQERHTQYLNLRDSQKAAPAGDGEKRPPRAATSKGFGKR
eukprot:PRCOL_00006542-RA